MSTLYEKLLAATEQAPTAPYRSTLSTGRALRAVVELHAPQPYKYVPALLWCGRCDMPADQCVEARAIAEALGVPTGDETT